jgi:hypothetical protein
MVKDNVTGLIWEVKTDDDAYGDKDQTFTWEGTRDLIDQLNRDKFGGRDDWRLPNIKELQSILDYKRHAPTIDPAIFPETLSGWYWSSTAYPFDTNRFWTAGFRTGYTYHNPIDNPDTYVRAVRGGQ